MGSLMKEEEEKTTEKKQYLDERVPPLDIEGLSEG